MTMIKWVSGIGFIVFTDSLANGSKVEMYY